VGSRTQATDAPAASVSVAPTTSSGPSTRLPRVSSFPSRGQVVGYVRVSKPEQSTERQLVDVEVDRIFEDRVLGARADRPALREPIEYVRAGDTIVVHSLDRLARNLDDLRSLVREITAKGVTLCFVTENLVFRPTDADPLNNLLLSVLGAFAEFERALIRERQHEGIAAAKAAGGYR